MWINQDSSSSCLHSSHLCIPTHERSLLTSILLFESETVSFFHLDWECILKFLMYSLLPLHLFSLFKKTFHPEESRVYLNQNISNTGSVHINTSLKTEPKSPKKSSRNKKEEKKRKRELSPELRWRRQNIFCVCAPACYAKDSLAATWNKASSAEEMATDDCYKAQKTTSSWRITTIHYLIQWCWIWPPLCIKMKYQKHKLGSKD